MSSVAMSNCLLAELERASAFPSHVTFATPSGETKTTFAEIWELSGLAATAISTFPSSRVAGMMDASLSMVACMVGCMRAGRDFVSVPRPPHGLGADALPEHLRQILAAAGATSMVVPAELANSMAAALPSLPVQSSDSLLRGPSTRRVGQPAGALIQCSSGSTNRPKAVKLSSNAIATSVLATLDVIELGAGDVSCHWVPLSHDMGLVGGLLTSWLGCARKPGGSPLVYHCTSPELFLARPLGWLERCSSKRATFTTAPAFAYELVSRLIGRGRTPLELSSLRICGVGAEPISPETLRGFAAAARAYGFNERALCPGYGLAEATLVVTLVAPSEDWSTATIRVDGRDAEYVSCGRPIACVEVQAPSSECSPGRIMIRGPALGEVAQQSDQPGWYDTRDVGVVSNGELFVTGRADDLLLVGGQGLHAWEIERIANACAGVRWGSAVAVADGFGRYTVLFEAPRVQVSPEACFGIRRALVSALGIGPAAVGCLPRGFVPKTPSGKIRRSLIRDDLKRFVTACRQYEEY